MPQFANYREVQIWKQASRESDEERLKNGSASVDDLRRENGLAVSARSGMSRPAPMSSNQEADGPSIGQGSDTFSD